MTPTEIDVRAIAEAVADVLAERGLVVAPNGPSARVLDAAGVAELVGRARQWVYDHADELGAFRYGDGPRARLGFDRFAIEQWMRARKRPEAAESQRARPGRRMSGSPATLIPYEGSGRGA
jgi:hypothetical protein